MQFIEMSGKTLARVISDDELSPAQLAEVVEDVTNLAT